MSFNKKEYRSTKTVGVMSRCKACKVTVRSTYQVECLSVDNGHPEYYLRKVTHHKRIAGTAHWQDAHYFRFPWIECPTCKKIMDNKAIDGRFNTEHPCDARCTGAKGHSCECSCGGANHGMDHAPKPLTT